LKNLRKFDYRTPRFDLSLRVKILAPWGPIEARCCDLSEQGMGAELETGLMIGSEVSVVFWSAEDSHPVQVRARVSYAEGRRHGFVFLFTSAEERQAVTTYLTTLFPSHRR